MQLPTLTPLLISAIATLTALPLINHAPAQANFLQAGSKLVQQLAQPEVKLHLAVQKKVLQRDAQGQASVQWQDLGKQAVVQPGDVLRYSLTGQNIGDAAARNLVLSQPIPAQMSYILDSASSNAGLKLSYSINGGKRFTAQPQVKIQQADGSFIEQPAPAESYTHVRWEAQGDLPPANQLMVTYEVKVR